MKKILIAVDYDRSAKKVAESGYHLAKAAGAETILLHVLADPVYYSSMEYSPIVGFTGKLETGKIQLDNIESLKKAAVYFLENLKEHLGGKDTEILVEEGELAESILSTAKRIHADLIVLGSHSRKWLENIVMGSVTEKVLQHTTVPLFVVPTRKKS
jgi:nucleotide-binding universal stress UspA family protein